MWKVNTGIAQSKPRATPGLVPRGMARGTDLRLPRGKKKMLGRRALDMAQNNPNTEIRTWVHC